MSIKLLQLNMWAGTCFPVIKEFIEQNDFDILCFQEVAGPESFHGNVNSGMDCYEELKKVLGATHKSEITIDNRFTSDPINSFEGNAIFYRNSFTLQEKKELWLKKRTTPFPSDATGFEDMGRSALSLGLEIDGKTLHVVTTHLAWARTKFEQPHQRLQNKKLIEYIKTLPHPFILTGDFNIEPMQGSILDLEKYARNLIKEYTIPNTIDPMHKAWERLKPGFSIDYIFVSPDLQVDSFEALKNVHMSDHLGLEVKIQL